MQEYKIYKNKIVLGIMGFLKMTFGKEVNPENIKVIPAYNFRDKIVVLKFKEVKNDKDN